MKEFENINQGYNQVFEPNKISIGVVVPIENYSTSRIPNLKQQLERVQLIEELGFKALWLRDIPFDVPSFGDAGQLFDPFTYLGYLAGQTSTITLGVSSIALPLHHPAHVAKSAASIDQLSQGRLVMGIASGDRYDEYPAMNIDYENRGELFRQAFEYIRQVGNGFPVLEENTYGTIGGNIDMLPKPTGHKIPLLMTGSSRQTLSWNIENTDGWMSYPKELMHQKRTIREWREQVVATQPYDKPFMQPLYIDLHPDDDFKPQPIHLGYKIGVNYFIDYIQNLEEIGVNHLALNLRFNQADIPQTLEKIAAQIIPHFQSKKETK